MHELPVELGEAVATLNADRAAILNNWLVSKSKTVSPESLRCLHADLIYLFRFCERESYVWMPTPNDTVRQLLRAQIGNCSNGLIQRMFSHIRQANEALDNNPFDAPVLQVLRDLQAGHSQTRFQPVRVDQLRKATVNLGADPMSLYTRAILWAIYDTQFRISSLLNARLETLKVVRPSGQVWVPPPARPVKWEEDGGFIPPSTACYMRDWFRSVGIVEGYLFPSIRHGQVTDEKGTPAQARQIVRKSLDAAGFHERLPFRSIREGALADMVTADVGIPKILRRNGLKSYVSVKKYFANTLLLDGGSLLLAKHQGRWGEPHGY